MVRGKMNGIIEGNSDSIRGRVKGIVTTNSIRDKAQGIRGCRQDSIE